MLADRLGKAWRARRGSTAVDPVMRFSDEGLVLGTGTVLAKSGAVSRDIAIDPRELRLQALLTAAHMRRPSVGALAHLRKAAERWSEGHDGLAAMHLALSRVDRLEQPKADAHRIFLADGLLNAGFDANVIIDAIEAGGPAFDRLQKYNPDQPRVPAGSGSTSGEWTSSDGSVFVDVSPGAGAAGAASPGSASAEAIVSAVDAPQQPLFPQQPEVNPSTITDAAYYDACREAKIDCLNAAVEVDSHFANDGSLEEDLGRCRLAETACNFLSIAIEDIPLLDYGGVIFPHQGVVLMQKGKQDRYIPPLPGGKRPYFRRNI